MKLFITLIFLAAFSITSCSQKKSVRKPSTSGYDSTATQPAPGGQQQLPGSNIGEVFTGDLGEAKKNVENTPLGEVFDGKELVKTEDDKSLEDDQIGINKDGDVLIPNPPGDPSIAKDDEVAVETNKSADGSTETVIKDKNGKVIATKKTNGSGTTTITTQIDPKTQKPVQEETINTDPNRKDANGNPVVVSKVIKEFYPNGTIRKVTIYGEDGRIDTVEIYNEEGKKTQEETLADDGKTVIGRTIYHEDGGKQVTTVNEDNGESTIIDYDKDGKIINEEVVVNPPEESALTATAAQYTNKVTGLYQVTTWNVNEVRDDNQGKESADKGSKSSRAEMQAYQEQFIPERDDKGDIVRDDDGQPMGAYVQPGFCALTTLLFNDVHGKGESTRCRIGRYDANTQTEDKKQQSEHAAYNGLYFVEASKNNDSDAYCSALCWQLETALKTVQVPKEAAENFSEKIADDPDKKKFCFLEKVEFANLGDADGPASCKVFRNDKNEWHLESKVEKDAKANCRATCVDIGDNYVAVDEETLHIGLADSQADKSNYTKFMSKEVLDSENGVGMRRNAYDVYQDENKAGTNVLSTVCGLTGVMMADVDDGKEIFQCRIDATSDGFDGSGNSNPFKRLQEIFNKGTIGADELRDTKVRWALWSSLIFKARSEGGSYNEDAYGECQAVCFQIKHDCDGDGSPDKELHEVCPLKEW